MKCEYCEDQIKEDQARITIWTKGYRYYFCSMMCLGEFGATQKGMEVIPPKEETGEDG